MRKLLLFMAYYLVITPYGLARQLMLDPLSRRWEPGAPTYLVRTGRAA